MRHTDTVFWPDSNNQIPTVDSTDKLVMILGDLVHHLREPHPSIPFLNDGTTINDAIRMITNILHKYGPPSKSRAGKTFSVTPTPAVRSVNPKNLVVPKTKFLDKSKTACNMRAGNMDAGNLKNIASII